MVDLQIVGLQSISATIRNMRASAKLSQSKLAKMSGMSQSMIARLERDIEALNPSYSAVYTVMQTLGRATNEQSEHLINKKASDIMHRNLTFLNHNDTVEKALRIIKNYDFAYIPVLDKQGVVIGTVRQKDLLELAVQRPYELAKLKVHDIAGDSLPRVDADTEVGSLSQILESFGAVVVVDKGKAVGIVTSYDVLKLV
jgi:predicted transcriptional regulator